MKKMLAAHALLEAPYFLNIYYIFLQKISRH